MDHVMPKRIEPTKWIGEREAKLPPEVDEDDEFVVWIASERYVAERADDDADGTFEVRVESGSVVLSFDRDVPRGDLSEEGVTRGSWIGVVRRESDPEIGADFSGHGGGDG